MRSCADGSSAPLAGSPRSRGTRLPGSRRCRVDERGRPSLAPADRLGAGVGARLGLWLEPRRRPARLDRDRRLDALAIRAAGRGHRRTRRHLRRARAGPGRGGAAGHLQPTPAARPPGSSRSPSSSTRPGRPDRGPSGFSPPARRPLRVCTSRSSRRPRSRWARSPSSSSATGERTRTAALQARRRRSGPTETGASIRSRRSSSASRRRRARPVRPRARRRSRPASPRRARCRRRRRSRGSAPVARRR